jgi:glycosyltransferase involved in cell wall biosynthesis
MLPFHLLRGRYNLFIGADIGHPGTYITFVVAKLLRKPFILCNEGWYYPRTIFRFLRQPLLNIMMLYSDAIVVSGTKAKEFALHVGADPRKVFIAPDASELVVQKITLSDTNELKERLGIGGKCVVLYLGRLVERKGVAVLIEAFSKIEREFDDAVLVIVGGGEERKMLERLSRNLHVRNALFTGYVDEHDKSLYYSIADVFVLPSLAHSGEVWDLVLNEAMSCAKSVISTTAAGASYDLIKNGVNGYIVKEGSVEELSDAMKQLLKNPEKARKMGFESKRIIESGFTFDRMVEGLTAAIKYATPRDWEQRQAT